MINPQFFKFTDLANQIVKEILPNINLHFDGNEGIYDLNEILPSNFQIKHLKIKPMDPRDLLRFSHKSQWYVYKNNENGEVGSLITINSGLKNDPLEEKEFVIKYTIIEMLDKFWNNNPTINSQFSTATGIENINNELFKLSKNTQKIITNVAPVISKNLLEFVAKNPNFMHELSPREFEHLIAEFFTKEGYDTEITKETRDGGKDILARKLSYEGNVLLVVECKKYSLENKVGIEIIQRLNGVRDEMQATKGIIATTSLFTKPAIQSASNRLNQIGLLDYYALSDYFKKYK